MPSGKIDLKKYDIAVVIPSYHVEREISSVLASLPRYIKHIIVVDDASPDGTADVVTGAAKKDRRIVLVRHATNQGVGGAMRTGFQKALELGVQIVGSASSPSTMSGTAPRSSLHLRSRPCLNRLRFHEPRTKEWSTTIWPIAFSTTPIRHFSNRSLS